MVNAAGGTLWIWRHPCANDAVGRCIGRVDLTVDPRRAKRLAHRIRRHARSHGLPREVWTSPLRRGADVGRWLARWGWRHRIDGRLSELDFGRWDGLPWDEIAQAQVDAWCADFANHRPGDGEALSDLFERCRQLLADLGGAARLIVGHGGWINAARFVCAGQGPPRSADQWPAPPGHGACVSLPQPPVSPLAA